MWTSACGATTEPRACREGAGSSVQVCARVTAGRQCITYFSSELRGGRAAVARPDRLSRAMAAGHVARSRGGRGAAAGAPAGGRVCFCLERREAYALLTALGIVTAFVATSAMMMTGLWRQVPRDLLVTGVGLAFGGVGAVVASCAIIPCRRLCGSGLLWRPLLRVAVVVVAIGALGAAVVHHLVWQGEVHSQTTQQHHVARAMAFVVSISALVTALGGLVAGVYMECGRWYTRLEGSVAAVAGVLAAGTGAVALAAAVTPKRASLNHPAVGIAAVVGCAAVLSVACLVPCRRVSPRSARARAAMTAVFATALTTGVATVVTRLLAGKSDWPGLEDVDMAVAIAAGAGALLAIAAVELGETPPPPGPLPDPDWTKIVGAGSDDPAHGSAKSALPSGAAVRAEGGDGQTRRRRRVQK